MDTKNLLQIASTHALRVWTILERQHGPMTFPTIELSGRYTKTAGACFMTENRVVLGTKFLVQFMPQMIAVIIPHELCHQVDFNKNGLPKNNRWHGAKWQKIMLDYGLPADPYHTLDLKK